jgi:hypothetical protein
MKTRFEMLRELANDTASLGRRKYSSAQMVASSVGAATLAAGISAQQSIGAAVETSGQFIRDAIDHEDTKAIVMKAKEVTTTATTEAKMLVGRVVEAAKDAEENHKEIADKIETVSMGLGIASGAVTAGAVLAAPTGLSAVGVALGITSAPLIVTAAPVICAASTVIGVVSGGAYFYSKWKTKKAGESQN